MGLDNILYTVDKKGNMDPISNQMGCSANTWRKYWDLHEYMEEVWRNRVRPSKKKEFNLVKLKLSKKDLDKLQEWFKSKDPDWEIDNQIDYVNDDDDGEISDVIYYRNHNKNVLTEVYSRLEEKGNTLYYVSWY